MVDIDILLAPVTEESPCGDDMSFSPEFDAIQEARRHDDPSLEQGEWVADLKSADWKHVVERCSELLRARSKDVRLAVWLAEAQAKTDGFPGLGAGYRLLAALCDRYWDQLHPLAEDGDEEQRVGNFGWLLSRSAQLVREIPLTQAAQGRYGLAEIEGARSRAARGDADERAAENQAQVERIDRARRETPREFYSAILESSADCAAALKEFERALDARLGTSGPSFAPTREALEAVILQIRRYAKDAGILGADEVIPDAAAGNTHAGSPGGNVSGEFQTRAQALAQLRRVADFFRRTEPHSPVAYLADKAATWGDMPLHAWLKTVIKDAGSLSHVEELLGLAQREPPAE